MKRLGLAGWGAAAVAAAFGLARCGSSTPPTPWAFLFYIPYDNNLAAFAAPVREAIRQGTTGGVPAFILEDLPTDRGVTLWSCARGACEATPVPEREDSADIETFRRLLRFAGERTDAQRYGVVILDHGGRQGELALDEQPGARPGPAWLSVEAVAAALADFDASEPGRVELLFAQVCSKASIEPLYTLRAGARTLLAAQLPLAAPNTWYADVLPRLALHPEWEGPQIAAAIAAADGPAMYAAYACFDSTGLGALPARLAALSGAVPLDAVASGLYGYEGEGYVDLGVLLDALQVDRALLDDVLCGVYRNPAPPDALTLGFPDPALLSGISMALSPDPSLSIHDVPGWSAWSATVVRQDP